MKHIYPLIKQLFMNIFVGSLPFKIEESELQEIFEEYGEDLFLQPQAK